MNSHVSLQVIKQALLAVLLVFVASGSFGETSPVDPAKKSTRAPSKSRAELKTAANQVATGIRAAEAALTPAELAIAQHVHVGQVACELGVSVNVKADPALPGYFDVQSKKFTFRMVPVVTSTGAIRLEDAVGGAVWLQLSNKSMLMSQKLGSRLADECKNPAQIAVAAAMLKNPPVSLLEPVAAPGRLPVAAGATILTPQKVLN